MSEMEEIKAETIYQDINNNHSGHSILNIIHFNDVYNIESGSIEPKAGAARFLTVINHLKNNKFSQSIVLFSGDAFSPSEISALTKGSQMVTCLNKFGIDSACIGNHDFDFGVERLTVLIHETNFPWLISNVVDKKTKKPLANAKVKHVLEIDNSRVGLIGLVEHEWIETLSALDNDDIIYECFVSAGNRLVHELRTIDY
ncbi:trifunctional nucleotide phosphoesterase -like [Brachionus plicatilis]|uniref:Trifunctional nucleotide phosphoesterase-like n=1 Tax=Brachionus plicatilis TaxID=10195 RepID=A0A3M7QK52_BRAPC|nr:trifunctional nucleotide phosphoesterase -like [Brachionus plicatilis]